MSFPEHRIGSFVAAASCALLLFFCAPIAFADDKPVEDVPPAATSEVVKQEEPAISATTDGVATDEVATDGDSNEGERNPSESPAAVPTETLRGEPGTATGLELSSNSIELGQSVTMTPLISGDASGFEFNYAWSWEGQWGDNWDSTVKRSGSRTSDASWEFTPRKPGTYSLWIDAVAPDGTTKQFDQSLQVNQEWQVESIQVGPTPGMVGTPVQVEVGFAAGPTTTNLSYNFG